MAEELDAVLRLEFEAAVAEVQAALDESLEASAAAFSDALASGVEAATVAVEVDTSAAEDALDAFAAEADSIEAEVPVEADTSAAEDALDAFAANADDFEAVAQVTANVDEAQAALDALAALAESSDYEAHVTADTSEAEAAIADLQAQTEDTTGSIDGLSVAGSGFQATADLATGSAAGLGSAVGELDGKFGAAVGAIAAGGAAVGVFFSEAIEAQSASLRFRNTLGDLASEVNQIDIGDLNTDISTLALRLGSSDDAMRQSATDAFLFATNAGVARREAATFSESVLALASRAVALNPRLGDVGTAAANLQRALVSGRDRALLPYNLGLDKTAVAARAAELATAAGRTEVQGIDKAMAAAELSIGKFGNGLQRDIAEGAKNPEIRLRSLRTRLSEFIEDLGKPLVAPVFDLLEQGVPVAEAAGRVIAELAQSALPLLTFGLQAVEAPLSLVADILELLPDELVASVGGALLLGRAFAGGGPHAMAFGTAIGFILPLLQQVAPEATSAVASIAGFAAAGAAFGPYGAAAGAAIGGVFALAEATGILGEDAAEAHKEIVDLAKDLEGLGAEKAARAFLEAEVSLEDLSATLDEDTSALARHNAELADTDPASRRADAVRDLNRDIRDLAETSPVAARRVVEGFREMARSGTEVEQTAARVALQDGHLIEIVEKGTETFTRRNAKADEAKIINEELAGSETATAAAIEAANAALDAFVTEASGALPTIPGLFQEAKQGAEAFGVALSPEILLARLQENLTAVRNFTGTMRLLIAGGFEEVAAVVAAQGPVVGGAFGQAFLQAPDEVRAALEQTLTETRTTNDQTLAIIETEFGPQIVNAYGQAVAPIPGIAANAVGQVPGAVQGGVPGVDQAGLTIGEALTQGVETGSAGAPAAAGRAATEAAAEGTRNTGLMAEAGRALGRGFSNGLTELAPAAGGAGRSLTVAAHDGARNTGLMYDAGLALALGFVNGLDAGLAAAREAGARLARAAKEGADNAGSPSVHLFHDAGVEQAAAYVDAVERAVRDAQAVGEELARAVVPDTLELPPTQATVDAIGRQVAADAAALPANDLVGAIADALRSLGSGPDAGTTVTLVRVDSVRDAEDFLPDGVDTSFLEIG